MNNNQAVEAVEVVPFEGEPEKPKVDLYADLKHPATRMAHLMAQMPEGRVYAGTVPYHVVQQRRAKNKRSRAGRRAQRKSK